jgi:hypothetical protein
MFCLGHGCPAFGQSQSPSAGLNRLGFISRSNRDLPTDTRVDAYLNATQKMVAATLRVTGVDLPGDHFTDADYRAMCKSLDLRGFIEPITSYSNNGVQVSGGAIVVITDCVGHVLFAGESERRAAFDVNIERPKQVDALVAAATVDLGQTLAGYVAQHKTAWDAMKLTGAMTFGDPTQLVAIPALEQCTQLFAGKQYAQTIASCAKANRDLQPEIPKIAVLMRIGSNASTDQSYILRNGLEITQLYYATAEANAQLADTKTGRPAALLGAGWVLALTGYLLYHFPDHDNPTFRTTSRQLTVVATALEKSYPGITKEAVAAAEAQRASASATRP